MPLLSRPRLAGVEGRSVAFLLPEQHILSEAFVEDVSNLLSSGEVAGLFGQEERDKIFGDLRAWAAAQVRDALWHAPLGPTVSQVLHLHSRRSILAGSCDRSSWARRALRTLATPCGLAL